MSDKIEVDKATWEGITHYLRALHQQGAVDDTKMHFDNYMPLERLLELWGIEPYRRSITDPLPDDKKIL